MKAFVIILLLILSSCNDITTTRFYKNKEKFNDVKNHILTMNYSGYIYQVYLKESGLDKCNTQIKSLVKKADINSINVYSDSTIFFGMSSGIFERDMIVYTNKIKTIGSKLVLIKNTDSLDLNWYKVTVSYDF